MARILKYLLILIASAVGLVVVASVAVFLFVDPNDYREEIATAVEDATGRTLTIEGDLSLSVFPWLAVDVGKTRLGNAPGFRNRPFMRFDNASLSVRLLPLIFRRDIAIGTASLEGLVVNLEVAEDGTNNWDDLGSAEAAPADDEDSTGGAGSFDVGTIRVTNAKVTYSDAATGGDYRILGLDFQSDGIRMGRPFDLDASFEFKDRSDKLGGNIALRGTAMLSEGAEKVSLENFNVSGVIDGVTEKPAAFNFDARAMSIDTVAERMSPGEMDFSILGVSVSANVEPFSYAGSPQPKAELRVAEFSLKELMSALDMEPPATANASALSRISFNASAAVTDEALSLENMTLAMDNSNLTGSLSLPMVETGAIGFDLLVDTINLDDYMAPPDGSAPEEDEGSVDDIEIPADMIRSLNAEGRFRIGQAFLSGMEFTDIRLGLKSADGKLRLNPLAAKLYDGTYKGDVRINASRNVPSISVDEKLDGVNLASLAKAMFGQENISGTISGAFELSGKGRNLARIRKDLDGTMSFELADGAWEGTDIWYQLRAARAMFRQEKAPKPKLPPRTEFTSMSATGTVTDGIFENNDLRVELPFLRLTGGGMVDLPKAQVNYSIEARVLKDPKLSSGMTQAELDDFTKTVVPVKITGPLASPSVRPDIEAVFRQQVEGALEKEKEKLKDRLLNDLLGGDEQTGEDQPQKDQEDDLEEQLKKKLLKDLIGSR